VKDDVAPPDGSPSPGDHADLGADPRVLREMVNASREAPVPELDWSKVEARLFAAIDGDVAGAEPKLEAGQHNEVVADVVAEEVRPSMVPDAVAAAVQLAPAEVRQAPPKRSYGWLGAFAVAAAFALVWFAREAPQGSDVAVVSEPIDPMKLPAAPGMPGGARDVTALNRGDVVEAALGPVSFGKLGVLEWTLAAGGRLAVRQALQSSPEHVGRVGSENHEIELESGAIDGVISAQHELVVVAGDTQIATVGPATLSITRSSQRLVIDLKEGSASVGRRGERTNVRVLSAPVRASFSLDGGLKFEVIPDAPVAVVDAPRIDADAPLRVDADAPLRVDADAPLRVDAPPSDAPPSDAPVAPAPEAVKPEPVAVNNSKPVASAPATAALPAPEPATDEKPALSDASVSSTLMSCLTGVRAKEQSSSAAGVSVSVSSTLTVQTREDGTVKSASFSPPLRAEMQSCAVFLFRSKLTGGARTLAVPVSL
jgi:hypothetical protein